MTNAPIHYKGTDYASVDAMPPEIRMAYGKELYETAAKETGDPDKQIDDNAENANDDSEFGQDDQAYVNNKGVVVIKQAVNVPVEFDAVTGLGPAGAVHMHQGTRLFSRFGTPRPDVVVIYRDGFAYRVGKEEPHPWRWEDVTVVQTNIWSDGKYDTHIEYEYTLTNSSGEKIILDNGVEYVADAMALIKLVVFVRLIQPLVQAYDLGQALTFGAMTIHKENGIQVAGKLFAWDAILQIGTENGRFTITMRDGKKHEVRQSAVPNMEMMAELIGLDDFCETVY